MTTLNDEQIRSIITDALGGMDRYTFGEVVYIARAIEAVVQDAEPFAPVVPVYDEKKERVEFESWVEDQNCTAHNRMEGDDWIDNADEMFPAWKAGRAALRSGE